MILLFVPIKWKARTKDYKFFNIKISLGLKEPKLENIKDYDILLWIRSYNLINKTERLIDYIYTVKMLPDAGEIGFDGECILESPDQDTIEFLLKNSDTYRMRVEYNIHKRAYPHAERIALEEGVAFLPSKLVLKDLKDDFSKKIKRFNEEIKDFNNDKGSS